MYSQTIYILNIQIDTFNIHNKFNNFVFCTFNSCCTIIRYSLEYNCNTKAKTLREATDESRKRS